MGSIRQAQPLDAIYKIASITLRKQVVRGRPPLRAAGSMGSISTHSPSRKSLGYPVPSRICCLRAVSVQAMCFPYRLDNDGESQTSDIAQLLSVRALSFAAFRTRSSAWVTRARL